MNDVASVRAWVEQNVPGALASSSRGRGGGAARAFAKCEAVKSTRSGTRSSAASGLVVPAWPVEYGGLGVSTAVARAIDAELRRYNLGRLNPLGLNLAAPALFAFGTEEQRRRVTCRRSCATRRSGASCSANPAPGRTWRRSRPVPCATATRGWSPGRRCGPRGRICRTSPSCWPAPTVDVPKRDGLTYFLLDLRQPGVDIKPLRHLGGEVDFNEVFLDGARVPDDQRVGDIGAGWKVANATLSGERQMVSGAGSGGVDRIGGSGVGRLVGVVQGRGGCDPVVRQELVRLHSEERIRDWTNQRVRAQVKAGRSPGPESSVGKLHQSMLNQRIQLVATDLLGAHAMAWPSRCGRLRGLVAVRDQRHAAEPGQHHRGRHDRGEQEHRR